MALSVLTLFSEARNVYGFTGTLAQVQEAITAVDRTPYETAERTKYQIRVWDEVTPLAGHDRAWWKDHLKHEWPDGGKIFTVYVNGNLHIVQPFDPNSGGFVAMDETTALARAQAIVDARVEEAVDAKVKEQVLLALLAG